MPDTSTLSYIRGARDALLAENLDDALLHLNSAEATLAESPLPDPPPELADAWERFQHGGGVEGWELSKLDEWRADCAQDAGF